MVAEGGEGENPLPFSLTPQNAKGVEEGGVSRLRFPPGPHLRSSRFSRHPRLRQAPTRRFAKKRNLRFGWFLWGKAPGPWWAGPQALGARAPNPLETWPTGPWGLDPATLIGFKNPRLLAQASGDLANKPLSPASRQPSRVKNSAHRLMKSSLV